MGVVAHHLGQLRTVIHAQGGHPLVSSTHSVCEQLTVVGKDLQVTWQLCGYKVSRNQEPLFALCVCLGILNFALCLFALQHSNACTSPITHVYYSAIHDNSTMNGIPSCSLQIHAPEWNKKESDCIVAVWTLVIERNGSRESWNVIIFRRKEELFISNNESEQLLS